jgi:tRNA threonylcarbamoyladenosine biosynthesis protein TsaB
MNILAIDTATDLLCCSLQVGDARYEWSLDSGLRHTELLMDVIDGICRQGGISATELHGLVCSRGPGSFTGLRIGMACAKGLSAALGIPLASVSALDAIASRHQLWPGPVLVAMDARKSRFYAGIYLDGHRQGEIHDLSISALVSQLDQAEYLGKTVMVSGPHADLFMERLNDLPASDEHRSHVAVVQDVSFRKGWGLELLDLGRQRIDSGNWDPADLGPDYVRSSDAEINITRA